MPSFHAIKLTRPKVQALLDPYDLGEVRGLSLMKGGFSNQSYRVDVPQGSVLLRVHVDTQLARVRKELQILRFLQGKGIPVAAPVIDLRGRALQKTRHGMVAVYPFVLGQEPKPSPAVNRSLGKLTAQLNALRVPTPLRRKPLISFSHAEAVVRGLGRSKYQNPRGFALFEETCAQLKQPLRKKLPMGLIHGDLYPDNTVFRGTRVAALLDFEDSCYDVRLRDLTTAIMGFAAQGDQIRWNLARELVRSYQSSLPLKKAELALVRDYLLWSPVSMATWYLQRLSVKPSAPHIRRLGLHLRRIRNLSKLTNDEVLAKLRT